MINFVEYNNISAISDSAPISVDAVGAIPYTIPAGKKGVSFQNLGTKMVWYGGATVNPSENRGHKMTPRQVLAYKGVKNTFKIYFICSGTDTSTIGVIQHD